MRSPLRAARLTLRARRCCSRRAPETLCSNARAAPPRRAVAFELSRLLDTGLDRETLSILISLVESGVHPDALAAVVKELRREAAELKARARTRLTRVWQRRASGR